MKPLYCSKGHENPTGTNFCQQCGEKLSLPTSNNLTQGSILGGSEATPQEFRYRIVRELGHGGFGRTYLALDLNRFNEPCVLKEFAPQVQGSYALQKAEQLFEREAGVLYKLQHPQIPRFREMFRVNTHDTGRLFLVQDYVEGDTYRALLEVRRQQGLKFTEAEVTQLLFQILPVLEYIHSNGVIHRDISPDNLMLRSSDNLPVLIDFGGVKQVAATVESQFSPAGSGTTVIPTRLGKVGYAPEEQMQRGIVFPHSDLYALAVTMLVLLTGKQPHQLINPQTLSWDWRREVSLSPTLESVLDKMLQPRPGDRYQSVSEVLQALSGNLPIAAYPPTQPAGLPSTPSLPTTEATLAVVPPPVGQGYPPPHSLNPSASPATTPASLPSQPRRKFFKLLRKILLVPMLIAAAGGIGWWAGNLWLHSKSDPGRKPPEPTSSPSASSAIDGEQELPPQVSASEKQRKEALRQRRLDLGIDYNFYVDLVNEAFWIQNPNQRGRRLSNEPEDEQLRQQWDKISAQLLDKLETSNLSSEARRRLGSYSATDRERWKVEVNKLRLSSRALYDLTDGKYLSIFSDYSTDKLGLTFEQFLNTPMGQVWQAMVADQVKKLQSGTALETIRFEPGATSNKLSATLKPSEGKAYIAQLNQGQLMQVQLQTGEKVLFSVYSPTGKMRILEDSRERNWSGQLTESGYYEFVVISNASGPIDYQLNLTVENSSSPATPSPQLSESKPPG
ncbi:MAG: protein kinase [Aphanothece sp. CMT-3BRIN-NPC111]|jgi:serine/threonine-protein kinase|nr:protein kinase [Aphanothece sp. CMT-3BRIN-NPC111]